MSDGNVIQPPTIIIQDEMAPKPYLPRVLDEKVAKAVVTLTEWMRDGPFSLWIVQDRVTGREFELACRPLPDCDCGEDDYDDPE